MSEEKPHDPSPKRREDAARDGDVLQSRDFSTGLVMATGAALMLPFGPWMIARLGNMLSDGLHAIGSAGETLAPAITATASASAPLLALSLASALAAPAILGTLQPRFDGLRPQWKRIDPLAGLKRMAGAQAWIELAKSLAKVGLVGGVGIVVIATRFPVLLQLSSGDPSTTIPAMARMLAEVCLAAAAVLLLIGVTDVPIQLRRRNARLRMSTDEVRREQRESDGAPELKRARRDRQYAIAYASARSAMTNATMILTNPTHFAVALRYRPDRDAVPVVVAKGVDIAAQAIRDLAEAAELPVLEYPELTRAIYFTGRAMQPIREELYLAVATILAFVFDLDRALAAGRHQPDVAVPDDMRYGGDGKPVG